LLSDSGQNKKLEKNMLGSFIAHGLNQEDAESEIVVQKYRFHTRLPKQQANDFSIAGSDTTATVIRTTMLHLVINPRITAKLRKEFSSNPISSSIKVSEARQLP
jgi:hypothetical protein